MKDKSKKEKIFTTLSPLRYQVNKVVAVGHKNSPRMDVEEIKEEISNMFAGAAK